MINVNSTRHAKRVARDLREALAEVDKAVGHSACLEMSARMLGHPSYGMLSRSASRPRPMPCDAEVPAMELASRRALQATVLLQAGIPPDVHDAIFLKVRPTARSGPRPSARRSLYGCAWLDGNSSSGWACVAGGEPFRFGRSEELHAGTTWWSTLGFEERYRAPGYPDIVLYDNHLGLTPLAALQEQGLDLSDAERARAAASLAAEILGRARTISDACVSASRYKTLREAFAANWKRDHGTDEMPAESLSTWEEFIPTSLRTHRGRPTEVLRKPRLGYARAMMDAPIPAGPYEYVNLSGNRIRSVNLRHVDNDPTVAFVRVLPPERITTTCPIRAWLWHHGAMPGWLSRPVYDTLRGIADLTPVAAMRAPGMRRPREFLPDAAASFLDRADPASWADGIVAEAVWRSGLSNPVAPSGSWQRSMAGIYLRGVDVSNMCAEAIRLHGEGMAVSSYGLGWVRYTSPGG